MTPEQSHVADLIRTAFTGVPRPPAGNIAPHACEDCAALSAALAPYTAEALPDAVIEAEINALCHLSPEAFVYYLPAYLLYGLRHFVYHHLPTEMALYTLLPRAEDEANEEMADLMRSRLKSFTAEQIQAVDAYLRLAEADPAFRRYYGAELTDGRPRLLRFWEERWSA